ncbi:hypothetical protein BJ508DRAFT_314088 [Ascobolus immersus RN42]|uniref:Uncharacterized protein n=1 Tax=Ascobolus immersus RN42 TaxID=1160509 RepID=A0A3N4HJQ1_ASCIM|nr:hypothetical protein BJ508DRAFT_314088 [Ascobolus immersus RN42]
MLYLIASPGRRKQHGGSKLPPGKRPLILLHSHTQNRAKALPLTTLGHWPVLLILHENDLATNADFQTQPTLADTSGPVSTSSTPVNRSAHTPQNEASSIPVEASRTDQATWRATKYDPRYPLSADVDPSERFCIGRMGAVLNGKVIDEGWRAGLEELGINMTLDELDQLSSEEMKPLRERVVKTRGYRHMIDYVLEASTASRSTSYDLLLCH